MSLTFEEIAIAFSNCNSDAKTSFKNYLVNLYKSKEDYEKGFIISNVNNYILTDIEKLLAKAVLNICAADNLIKQGYFSWGFVTSYYANFFLIQGLNRTQLNFTTWVSRSIDCVEKDYQNKNLTLSLEPNQVQNNWQFTEVWIDPMLTPPYILLLLADEQGKCQVYDPAKNYQVIFSSNDYETAKLWLLEDEYEPIEGRLLLDDLLI